MKLFNTLMSKIFGTSSAASTAATTPAAGSPGAGQPSTSAGASQTSMPAASAGATAAPPQGGQVDVDAVLTRMASENSEKLDWKKSIVDLMKLVGMDSSLSNRKELAKELGYTGDMDDSATMNMWLHKQVMRKLSENGGKVPANLLD